MLLTIMGKRKHPSKPKKTRNSKVESLAGGRGRSGKTREPYWIYGVHAALAVLANPERICFRVLIATSEDKDLEMKVSKARQSVPGRPEIESLDRGEIKRLLGPGAVHQGVALLAGPLPDVAIEDVLPPASTVEAVIVVLDQASDPRNVGAVMRSAAAFGAAAVVVQDRHGPPVTGALCKAASGAVEWVPLVRTVNIARTLKTLKDTGFWCLGLDGSAKKILAGADMTGKVALVLGSEGGGLRRLVRDSCDLLVRVPISDPVESLNLSNAAAVALYELRRGRP
jgi:23S rRNA (guanosine2251-2'-O)-methyltransferase